jgi:hypothetical protein
MRQKVNIKMKKPGGLYEMIIYQPHGDDDYFNAILRRTSTGLISATHFVHKKDLNDWVASYEKDGYRQINKTNNKHMKQSKKTQQPAKGKNMNAPGPGLIAAALDEASSFKKSNVFTAPAQPAKAPGKTETIIKSNK